MSRTEHLHLWAGYGIELEYMIVDRQTLAVRPISDELLTAAAGKLENEVESGDMAWSNELVMHVIEMKTNGPSDEVTRYGEKFMVEVRRINALLEKKGAMLMPSAMHPFFDPDQETKLWPHDSREIYDRYNEIFDCRGHGWSNLQSVHINFPFFDHGPGGEFGKLHAAIRMALPLLPALAASSPIYGGRANGLMDNRLEFYRMNQRRLPALTGGVIPERAFTREEYAEQVFKKVMAEVLPYNEDGLLEEEWLNSRGAIARFDRNAIEIRVLDIQETPKADQAVITAVVGFVQALAAGEFLASDKQREWEQEPLRRIFEACVHGGSETEIEDRAYLDALHYPGKTPARARDVWKHVIERSARRDVVAPWYKAVEAELGVYFSQGTLAERILLAAGATTKREDVMDIYRELCGCLAEGRMFRA